MDDEIKVSELPLASQVNNDDLLMIIQGQANKKIPFNSFNNSNKLDIEGLEEAVQNLLGKFNFSLKETITAANITTRVGTIAGTLTIETNEDESSAKIYGAFTCTMSNPRHWI